MGWGEPQGRGEPTAIDTAFAELPPRLVEHALAIPPIRVVVRELTDSALWNVAMRDDGSIGIRCPDWDHDHAVLEVAHQDGSHGWRFCVTDGSAATLTNGWRYVSDYPEAVGLIVEVLGRAVQRAAAK